MSSSYFATSVKRTSKPNVGDPTRIAVNSVNYYDGYDANWRRKIDLLVSSNEI